MFCSKCGKTLKTNICEYCGTSDNVYHSNNYIKSPEMLELLSDDKDFYCVKEEKMPEIHEELQTFETPDKNITKQVTEDTLKKTAEDDIVNKENNTKIKKHTYMTNKGKNVIIAVLCIIIAGVSTAYAVLLKKYNNISEINNNALSHNTENSENSITPATESDETTESITITESTMNLSTETQTSVVTEVSDNATDGIIQERNKRAETLFKKVKNQKYNGIQIDKILSLYENKQSVLYFDDFNYEDEQNEYNIDFAIKCINGNNKWDSSVNCGGLFDTDTKNHKLMYYFMENNTIGKQYVLTDKDAIPDIDDIIYIEPVENSLNRCYYMARYCNNILSMYIIIDNNVYDFVKFEAKTKKY